MPSTYVIVLKSSEAARTENELTFEDDTHALVEARRLFIQELMIHERRPLSLLLGRQGADGRVDWLNTWRSADAPDDPCGKADK